MEIQGQIDRAVEVLRSAKQVASTCHVGPDGDALGSALALARAAHQAGKEACASFGEPFHLSERYGFLPLDVLVPPSEFPDAPEVVVAFDAGSLDRLGELAGPAKGAETLIVVDHHISNRGFGDVDIIDPEAAASAELALRLIKELGWPLDSATATCLLMGLVTDTGRFQYSNTTPATLRAAATLVEAGARPELIGQQVYESVPFAYLAVQAAVLGRAALELDRSLVWSLLRTEDLERAGLGMEDTEPLIDALRVAREAEVTALAKELSDGTVKVSLRSRGGVNVEAIASELGGGGHHNASGFTFKGSPEEAIGAVRARLSGG